MKTRLTIFMLLVFTAVCGLAHAGQYKFETTTGTAQSKDASQIAYTVYTPQRATLVFVHGWSCDQSYWKKQVEFFAKYYDVVTIDLAAHGKSVSNRTDYTISSFGDDIAAVVEKLDVKRAILIGHSMGGDVMVNAATKLGDRVAGVVGIDTLHDFGFVCTQEISDQLTAPIKADFKKGTSDFVASMFIAGADEEIKQWVISDMASAPPATAVAAMENYFKYDIKADLAKLKVPVASVNADLWPTNAAGNKAIYPDFSVVILPETGHFLMLEKPDEFNRALKFVVKQIINS